MPMTKDVNLDNFLACKCNGNPDKPGEGEYRIWMSDGVGLGDDGDIIIASTVGGVTKYAVLFDHSAGTTWE